MSRLFLTRALSGACVALSIGACTSPQVGNPCPVPVNADNKTRLESVQKCFGLVAGGPFPFRLKKDVDILFMIDNSPSMTPKQKKLADNIKTFIEKIEGFGINYHVGIVTSDIGTTVSDSATWDSGSSSACNKFRGDDGELQTLTCDKRSSQVSQDAIAACNDSCKDNTFRPTNGDKFISKIEGQTNVPKDMKLDPKTGTMVDYGPINAFKCMALVGDGGCGVEGQLEAVKRALITNGGTINRGFLRNGSVLAVIMITDEDDCSVKAAKRTELNPSYRNCNAGQPDEHDCYKLDDRCLFRSLKCNEPMTTAGGKTGCFERPDNFLEPVKTYYDALLSIRRPEKLVVSGIWTKPSIDVAIGGTVGVVGGPLTSDLKRDPACQDPADPNIKGQPQFRLSQFASLFGLDRSGKPAVPEIPVCNTADYPAALDTIANLIEKKFAPCLPVTVKTQDGKPICLVGDVDENTPDAVPDKYFPLCSDTCCAGWANADQPSHGDSGIKTACQNEQTAACFCAVKSTKPAVCAEGVNGGTVIGVWRKDGANTPAGKTVNFRCAGY